MFTASLFIWPKLETIQRSISWWLEKQKVVDVVGYLPAMKRDYCFVQWRGECQKLLAKEKKPDAIEFKEPDVEQTLNDFIYLKFWKTQKSRKRRK